MYVPIDQNITGIINFPDRAKHIHEQLQSLFLKCETMQNELRPLEPGTPLALGEAEIPILSELVETGADVKNAKWVNGLCNVELDNRVSGLDAGRMESEKMMAKFAKTDWKPA